MAGRRLSFCRPECFHLAEPDSSNLPLPEDTIYPRFVELRLSEALEDSPAVLIHGPRQSGKTTLARRIGQDRGYIHLDLDDDTLRDAAEADPIGFVADLPARVILDEVQRTPALFRALKAEIDRKRAPGRFLMAGSTHVLLVPRSSDSLAGHLRVVRLHPLSQAEIARSAPDFLDALFGEGFPLAPSERLGRQLADRIAAGGYPPALALPAGRRRAGWHRNDLASLVERDVREVARIGALEALPRLLGYAAAKTAGLFNVNDLASPFQLTRPTVRSYLTLLERIFLLERLPAWQSNPPNRLIKTPKLHLSDTGLACALLGVGAEEMHGDRALLGQLLETFVFQELKRQAGWRDEPTELFHFRDRDGFEVDLVLEQGGGTLAGVEVKASSTVRGRDFRGLRKLASAVGTRFVRGVVLYDGETCARFGERLHAVPIRRLWESPAAQAARQRGTERATHP